MHLNFILTSSHFNVLCKTELYYVYTMHISTWCISASNHIKKETKVFHMIFSNKLVVFFLIAF